MKETVLWDTQKNTEEEEKWAQKKEELVKEIRENRIKLNITLYRE
tara:strand:+ start:501 stop:635 length:135 start_codon:yes stop_codon:yes gene_type:complete